MEIFVCPDVGVEGSKEPYHENCISSQLSKVWRLGAAADRRNKGRTPHCPSILASRKAVFNCVQCAV